MRPELLLLCLLAPGLAAATPLAVGAASSLTDVLPTVGREFASAVGEAPPAMSFASSGTVGRQVAGGAPLDAVVLADADQALRLAREGVLIRGSLTCVATNRISLVAPRGARFVSSWADLGTAAVRRVALGNPSLVPAGRLARQHLEALRLWEAVVPKAMFAASVRQALAYARRGEVDAAIVFRTDARAGVPEVRVVDASSLRARYVVGVVAGSPHEGEAYRFLAFLRGSVARSLFAEAGFGPCQEEEP
ncbi:MAG: molybdate ABC transporter substrate-binding protein [Deltaproteobacteria bacterium]|nr:molybdate ABC transporter substrate-binding protein [Deltaproteobacteria bacterium]